MGFLQIYTWMQKLTTEWWPFLFFYRQSTIFLVSLDRPYRPSVLFTLFVRCCHATQNTDLSERGPFLQVIKHQRPLLLGAIWNCEVAAFKNNPRGHIPGTSVWRNSNLWWFPSFGMYILHKIFYQFSSTVFLSK